MDGTASYSYDPEGQLTGQRIPQISNLKSLIPPPSPILTTPTATAPIPATSPALTTNCSPTARTHYQYDADGNQIERTNIATGAITLYTWDNRNRLVGVTDETAHGQITQTVTYQYDASNRWIGETVTTYANGSPSSRPHHRLRLQRQPDRPAVRRHRRPRLGDTLTAANLSHRYLSGQAVDQVFADEQVTSPQTPGNVVWTLTDNLGTVRDLAVYNAQTGVTTVANHRVYDSFGNLTSQTNAAVDCLFGFAGLPFDTASGT